MKNKLHRTGFLLWNIQRAFSFPFLLAVFLVVLTFLGDADNGQRLVLLGRLQPMDGSVISELSNILNFGMYYDFSLIFLTIPFACKFCSEWNSGFCSYILPAVSLKGYAANHIGFSAISGGMCYMLGAGGYIFMLSRRFQVYDIETMGNCNLQGLGRMITTGEQYSYLGGILFLFFLWGCLWGAIASCASTIITNPYVVAVTPYFLNRCYIEAAKQLNIPACYRVDFLFKSKGDIPFSAGQLLGITTIITLGVCIICWFIFEHNLQRRLENERT